MPERTNRPANQPPGPRTWQRVGWVFVALALKARTIAHSPVLLLTILVPLVILYAINYAFSTMIGRAILPRADAIAMVYGSVMRNLSIALAIAIHNIPEGIAVSMPIYYATGSKKKAFIYSSLSGFAEPVGALTGFFLLQRIFGESMFGFTFAAVAGIMVYISLDELLPTAEKYGEHHIAIYGLIAGMIVMASSLLLFV